MTTDTDSIRSLNGLVGKDYLGNPYSGYYTAYWTDNIRTLASNPKWREQIAARQDASMTYSRRAHELDQSPLVSHGYRNANPSQTTFGTLYNTGGLTPVTSIPAKPDVDDRALGQLKSHLAKDQGAFQALIPLGEFNETLKIHRTIQDTMISGLKTLISIKKGRPRDALKYASRTWLGLGFGINPLIRDLQDLYGSIDSYLNRQDYVGKYYGKAEEQWNNATSIGGASGTAAGSSACNWTWSHRDEEHHYSVQYTAGVLMNLRSSNNYGIAEHFGLQIGELPSLAWELTPFSWVGDYFTNFGDFLADTFSSDAGNTIYCTKSVKYTVNQRCAMRPVAFSGFTITKGETTVQHYKAFLFSRTVHGALPHRSFRFKTADEVGFHSVNKLLNLASILLK